MSEQTEIPGCEDPQRIPEIDETLFAWIDAREAKRKAADTTKIRHASLLERLAALGVERYAYLDKYTGKKCVVVVRREPKAATARVPGARRPRKQRADRKHPEIEARVAGEETDSRVEHRKVSRESVAAEVDPFGATRAAMEPSA